MSKAPAKLTIRTYNVGFGDCFLLTFHYADEDERHVLIDFGSQDAEGGPSQVLRKVAHSIKTVTNNKLDVVVATHRHQDHIRGFGLDDAGKMIEAMKPKAVLQPWTEDPKIGVNAKAPRAKAAGGGSAKGMLKSAHVLQLADMNAFAEDYFSDLRNGPISALKSSSPAQMAELAFTGSNNIKNLAAVQALIRMSSNGRGRYLHAGQNARLSKILPGVKVEVLGPPTVSQHDAIRKQTARQADEFWHLHAAAAAKSSVGDDPFGAGNPAVRTGKIPLPARWFCHRLRQLRADTLMGIVRHLDTAMNNTSLVLLFTVGDKAILFPGDAQYENWQYIMDQDELMDKLAKVQVYKVGHHGSLNATPKSVWEKFDKKGNAKKAGKRLQTLLSTRHGKHGHEEKGTEVPRRPLVKALKASSDVTNTEEYGPDELFRETVVKF